MLSAERLYELPLDVRVYIANMDMEAYIRMYLYDDEFRMYARGSNAVDEFIERFVAKRKYGYTKYKINDIIYYKYDDGGEYWYKGDFLHRLNGPSISLSNGDRYWYANGELHREDGPAAIYAEGRELWYINGKLHKR